MLEPRDRAEPDHGDLFRLARVTRIDADTGVHAGRSRRDPHAAHVRVRGAQLAEQLGLARGEARQARVLAVHVVDVEVHRVSTARDRRDLQDVTPPGLVVAGRLTERPIGLACARNDAALENDLGWAGTGQIDRFTRDHRERLGQHRPGDLERVDGPWDLRLRRDLEGRMVTDDDRHLHRLTLALGVLDDGAEIGAAQTDTWLRSRTCMR